MNLRATPALRHSTLVRYSIAVVTAVGAVLVTRALRTISPRVPADLIYCATIFSAWFGGTAPGLVAASISSAAIGFHFIPPPAPGTAASSELPRVAVISLGVFVVSWISGQQRRAEQLLQQARAELEDKVQERTAELRRSNDALQVEMAERKAAEESLYAMQTELAHVSRITMMGELTASIAHEVNQPLAAITNYANACRRLLTANPASAADIDQALSKIVEDAHRASDVMARIRALSQKKAPERTPAAIKDLVEDVVAVAQHEMRVRGITTQVELAADLPPLQVDRVQIQQVLLNLIINGIEAMEAVAPSDRVVEIDGRTGRCHGAAAVVLRVRDHGSGVKPGNEDRLFVPFYSTKPRGLGLGLSISRSIIEAHGGSLSLLPSEGAGATFQILLPVAEEPIS